MTHDLIVSLFASLCGPQVGGDGVDELLRLLWRGHPDQERVLHSPALPGPARQRGGPGPRVQGVQAGHPAALQPGGLPPYLGDRALAAGVCVRVSVCVCVCVCVCLCALA